MTQPALQVPMFEPYTFRFSAPERAVFRRRERVATSVFMDRHIYFPEEVRGTRDKFRLQRVPYLQGVVDRHTEPRLRRQFFAAAPQTGKTIALYGRVLSDLVQSPAPSLAIMAGAEGARNVSKDYLQPIMRATPPVQRVIPTDPDDFAGRRMLFLNGERLLMGYASSPQHFKTFAAEHVYGDEREDWPVDIAGFGSPAALLDDRTRTFPHTSKSLIVSSLGSMQKMWKDTVECQRYEEHLVYCPACGVQQRLVFSQIKIPPDVRDPDKIETHRLAWYECAACADRWDDYTRDRAVALGEWQPVAPQYTDLEAQAEGIGHPFPEPPASVPEAYVSLGQRLPGSWYSQDVSLSQVMAAFLRAHQDPDPAERRALQITWTNSHACLPWRDEPSSPVSVDRLLRLKDHRPPGLVPEEAVALFATVDTQDDGFWYTLRAWAIDLTSWGVRYGFVADSDALRQIILADRYATPSGAELAVAFGLWDSGGHRTAEVYDLCRAFGVMRPSRGEQRMRSPVAYSRLETYPGSTKTIPGGMQLVRVHTTYFKDALAARLDVPAADPGAWHLHGETDEDYARQLTAEYRDVAGLWHQRGRRPNHLWDCGVLQLACAEVVGVRHWAEPRGRETPRRTTTEPAANPLAGRTLNPHARR